VEFYLKNAWSVQQKVGFVYADDFPQKIKVLREQVNREWEEVNEARSVVDTFDRDRVPQRRPPQNQAVLAKVDLNLQTTSQRRKKLSNSTHSWGETLAHKWDDDNSERYGLLLRRLSHVSVKQRGDRCETHVGKS
jgi:hypothetical protein